MKKAKAQKHLKHSREHLDYLRESYVAVLRDPAWKALNGDSVSGRNYFKERLAEIRKEMEEAKIRIAKFERVVF